MSKQIKARRTRSQRVAQSKSRELWLAAIGAVSLTRKQGAKAYAALLDEGRSLQDRLGETVEGVGEQVKSRLADARGRAEALVDPLRDRAETLIGAVKGEVETRLQPVLSRLGVQKKAAVKRRPAAKSAARKPAARKTASKRASTKVKSVA